MHSDPRLPTPLAGASRYQLLLRIASGGMGSVYLGTQRGAAGFRRVVAIKRAFPHLLEDPTFRRLLAMEARLASLVQHPNVVGITDVEDMNGELILVMDYIEGTSLAELLKSPDPFPASLGLRILLDAAEGLEAVHKCTDEEGHPLALVHRDVSPQNVLVGLDGIARIADFGIAQIHGPSSPTRSGLLRGKPSYMAPEYIETGTATPASDVFSLGVVAWETLTRERLFRGATDVDTLNRVRAAVVPAPSTVNKELPPAVDAVILRALAQDPSVRFHSAHQFAAALETALAGTTLLATRREVRVFVRQVAGADLAERRSALQNQNTDIIVPRASYDSAPEIPVVMNGADETTPTNATRILQDSEMRTGFFAKRGSLRQVAYGAMSVIGILAFGSGAVSLSTQRTVEPHPTVASIAQTANADTAGEGTLNSAMHLAPPPPTTPRPSSPFVAPSPRSRSTPAAMPIAAAPTMVPATIKDAGAAVVVVATPAPPPVAPPATEAPAAPPPPKVAPPPTSILAQPPGKAPDNPYDQ